MNCIHTQGVNLDLLSLSKSTSLDDRELAAIMPNCPPDILTALSKSKNRMIKIAVAGNPNTPSKILKKMSEDENEWVRYAVAINRSTPKDVLQKLYDRGDESWMALYFMVGGDGLIDATTVTVKQAVSNNPSFNDEPRILKLDETFFSFKEYNEKLRKLNNYSDEFLYDAFDYIERMPIQLLEYIAKKGTNSKMLRVLAEETIIPRSVIEILLSRKDRIINYGLLENHLLTPSDLMSIYENSDDQYTYMGIARHINAPIGLLEKMYDDERSVVLNSGVTRTIGFSAVTNANNTIEQLRLMLKHQSLSVRYYIAFNPNTTKELIQELMRDKELIEDKTPNPIWYSSESLYDKLNTRLERINNRNPKALFSYNIKTDNEYSSWEYDDGRFQIEDALSDLYYRESRINYEEHIPYQKAHLLSKASSLAVRCKLALHPCIDDGILHILSEGIDDEAESPSGDVIYLYRRIARNPKTSAKTLTEMSIHEDRDLWFYIVENPNCPEGLKDKLRDSLASTPNN